MNKKSTKQHEFLHALKKMKKLNESEVAYNLRESKTNAIFTIKSKFQ